MTTPHLNQIIELRDGTKRRVMIYHIRQLNKVLPFLGAIYLVRVVTSTGEKSEIYL